MSPTGIRANTAHEDAHSEALGPGGRLQSGQVVLALALLLPAGAQAAACCGGSDLPGFERLRRWETYAVGVRLGLSRSLGSWDADRAFGPDIDFHESTGRGELWGMVGVWENRLEGVVHLPAVYTWRTAGPRTADDGGPGDVSLAVRGTVFPVGEGPGALGLALVAGLRLPTGRSAGEAMAPLGVDATGRGVYAPFVGLSLERSLGGGAWFARADAGLEVPLPEERRGRPARAGEGLQVALLFGRELGSELTLSLVLRHLYERAPLEDDRRVPGGSVAETAGGVAASLVLLEGLSLQAAAEVPVVLTGLGRNHAAAWGTTLGVRWGGM